MPRFVLAVALVFAVVCAAATDRFHKPRAAASLKAVHNWQNVTNSVLWVPAVGLDCRATCTGAYLQPVNAYKPTAADPAPPLLCAHLGKLVNQDNLSIPKSLETEAHKFFLSEGYNRPVAANTKAGRQAAPDIDGCTSYLELNSPDLGFFLCGCVPPRKSLAGKRKKAWRWVAASSEDCQGGGGDEYTSSFFLSPFICRVTASGLLGHLNSQQCGFPFATAIEDCEYGGASWDVQEASGYRDSSTNIFNMPLVKPTKPECLYKSRRGVEGTRQSVANWNEFDRLCILGRFTYFVYRWPRALDAQA